MGSSLFRKFLFPRSPFLSLQILCIFLFLTVVTHKIVFPEHLSTRTINIKIAVDGEFGSMENWPLEIKRIVRDSSKNFENNFGIKFKIKSLESWSSDDSLNSMFELLNDLIRKVPQEESDVVLGFTAQRNIQEDLVGVASYLSGYILVRGLKSRNMMTSALTHEFSHIFGAVDLNEEGSIMDTKNRGTEFDDFTTQIILLNKFRSFNPYQFPLLKSELDEAISIFNQRKRMNRGEADIHVSLALIYLEKESYDSVIEECNLAMDINPDLPEIYNLLGIAYRRKGEIDQAIEQYEKFLHFRP